MSKTEQPTRVYKAGGASGSSGLMIHYDPDCYQLRKSNQVLEKPSSAFPEWVDRCPECWSDVDE